MDLKTQKILASVIANPQKNKVSPYTTKGEVTSVTDDTIYVKIEGSDISTPVKSSSVLVKAGDIVDISVSHTDTHITGNRTDVAASSKEVERISSSYEASRLGLENNLEIFGNDIKMIGTILDIQNSKIESVESEVSTQNSKIEIIESDVSTQNSKIETVESEVSTQNSKIETIESTIETHGSTIESNSSDIKILNSAFIIQNGKLTGISEIITGILKADYVTTDFLNAEVGWIEDGKIKQGAIGTVEIADESVTTAKIKDLSADVITTGTLKTECLILTTDEIDSETGEKKVALITALNAKVNAGEGNILNGAVIADNTIEAAKITVVDLNAFGATIGNFKIGTSSIHNGKTSITDPTNGVYIGTDGIALGQGSLLGITDDSPLRIESDGDFHLGGKYGNYINFDPFSGELYIDAKTIKIESKGIATSEDVETAIDDIEVGGRNLLSDTNVPSMTKKAGPGNKYLSDSGNSDYSTGAFVAVNNLPIPEFTHVYRFTCTTVSSTSSAGRSLCFYSGATVPMIDGQEYTMSMYARKTSGNGKIRFMIGYESYPNYENYIDVTSEWKRYSYTFTYSNSETGGIDGARCYFGASCAVIGVVETFGWKLERGNKATDWNLSMIDLEYASNEAAKVATNFMSYDSTNGLLIGNKTSGSWVGTRARITSNAFGILDSSGVELASYGSTSRIGTTTGNNVYINSSSIDIRNGTAVRATFDQYGLKIANSNDASGSLGSGTSKPALVIGSENGYHIEMDNNEIMAKSNATTSSHLFLNMEGGNVSVNNNGNRAIMFQDGAIYAKNSSYNNGSYLGIVDGLNENGNTTFGYGGYLNNIGETNIYGEKINLRSNSGIKMEDANGNECLRVYGTDQVSIGYHGYANNQGTTYLNGYDVWVRSSNYVYSDRRLRVLWSGSYYMKDGQSITLSDSISDQLTGVILAWSAYVDGAAGDYDWNYIFVPKEHVLRHSGSGVAMTLISSTGWTRGSKYVYVSDTSISGHSNNNKESTEENGWIVNPSRFVLRYVYGV